MKFPGWVQKLANLHIKDGRHGTSAGYPHVLENLDNYGCPGKVREKRNFSDCPGTVEF